MPLTHTLRMLLTGSGRATSVPISAIEFRALKAANKGLYDALLVEEAFDAVIQNYAVYERGQMRLILDYVVDRDHHYSVMDDARRKSALHLDNLLSSARSFLDSTPMRLKAIGGVALQARFVDATHRAYDSLPGYRLMEALRNYAQHRGSSINGMTWGLSRSDKGGPLGDDFKLIHTVEARLHVDLIEREFKAKDRPLLRQLAVKGSINLTPLVREYVVGMNRVVREVREQLEKSEAVWHELNEKALAKLEVAGPGWAAGAVAIDAEKVVDEIELTHRQKERTAKLRRKNGNLDHLVRSQLHA